MKRDYGHTLLYLHETITLAVPARDHLAHDFVNREAVHLRGADTGNASWPMVTVWPRSIPH
jgi:hypothetical protein